MYLKINDIFYTCDKFKQLSTLKRIEAVKKTWLCYNCLRFYRDEYKFSSCTICQRRHNTLLYLDKPTNTVQVSTSSGKITNEKYELLTNLTD